MLSKSVFLLAVLAAGSIAVAEDDLDDYQNDEPQVATQCAVTCPAGRTQKFGYETGKTYQYRYESDIKTSAPGATTEHSSLHMKANVQIEVVSTCEMTLKLTDVSLQDSNPANIESRQHVENAVAFRRGLQTKSMSFAFVDGQIDAVCADPDDETWAINVKRGILSAFQNTMSTLQGSSSGQETDVSGNCPVRYEQLSDGWRTRTVKKTKNLLACTDRQAGQTVFQAVQYDADSDIQSMPLMRSSHSCEQEINNSERIVTKATCTEVHVFRPFSGQDSGATTKVDYKLEYQTKTDGISSQRTSSRARSSLLYDHRLSDGEVTDAVREARASLTDLCRQTEVDVRPDAPAVFNGLVKQMRKLDSANLKRLLQASKNGLCSKAEKYFRDALPVLGTTGGVIVMRDLMSQADDSEVDRWLTSIAFISNPTPDMMKEIQPLLTSDFERSSLPVSSLINTYSQLYDDQQSVPVQQMIKTLEDELRYNCKYDNEAQRSRMIKALKAIGNAGNAERVVPTLNRCIANTEIPVSLRVAAVTAFRRLSCTADRSDVTRLMENKEADSELRIMAYLTVMQCANADVIGRVRNLLEADETNQVGSFVWTHLTNIQETSCPMKADIQDILKDVVLTKAYDMDKRKFSRNVELSGFSEIFNVGALAEGNLIWSAQSFVPRSASVNLTFDVFGQSVNLLELGGRVQGIEAMLEKFFGPGKDSDNSIREKRAVIRDDAFNIIDRKFSKTRDDLTLSYYMRVFGNEIRSGEIYDLDFDGLKNRYNFLNWLIMLAQENRVDVTKNYLFLDSTFTVPTGAGLPLRLSVEGTATVAITASGKFDIRQAFSFPSIFDVDGSIRPSAAIEIKGEMGVDARFSKTGLRTVNRLHTSTILDGKIQLKDGKLFNLDLNLPREKVEIFSAESHVYVTYRGQDREQENIRSGGLEKKECTGDKITYIFGVELCGEVQLDGPFVAKAYVNKKDTYTGFHFEAGLQQSPAEMTDTVKISMSTPGSRIDREITVEVKADRANSQLDLNLKSPWKKIGAQGSLVNSAALKRASLRARLDDAAAEYSFIAEIQIDRKAQEIRYAPSIRVSYPVSGEETKEMTFEGTAVYTLEKKLAVNLALRNAFQQPITLDGSVEKQDKKKTTKYDTNFQFNSQFVRGSLIGFVANSQDNGNTWSSRADLNYQLTGGRSKERIVINHKFRDLSTNNLRSYSTDCSWTSTVHPRYNGQIGLELAFSPNSLRTKIEAGLDNVKKVTISQSGAFDFSGSDKKINGMVKFELPYKNWDYEVKVDHIHNRNTLQSNATVKYGENQQISLDVGSKMDYERFLRLAGEIYFKMPNVDMSITQNLVERAPREYHGDVSIQGIPRIGSARATTIYKMQPRHEFSADVNVAGWEPISVKGHLNPSIRNLQARGEFSQGRKNFLGDVSWLHTGTETEFNTRASAEVGYYGRSHTLTADVTRRAQEFSTNAVFKYSDDKRFAVSSQVTAIATEPKVQVRLDWPNSNFVELQAQGKYETKGWYTTTNDLEGKLQFTSSIPRLEAIGGSFRHDKSAKSMKTTGEVYWTANSKISGDFSYDKNKLTLEVTTPFEGFETLKAEFANTPKGRMFGHTAKVSWNENQMVLTIVGEFNKPSITGKVTFTSPFVGYEALSAGLKHIVTDSTYTTNADVSWATDKQITVAVNMNHNRDGWAVTNNGDLTVLTPFRELRKMRLVWTHKNDNSMWKCRHEFEYNREKYMIDVDATNRLTRTARLLTAAVSLQAPLKGLEDVRLNAEYQHDLRGVKSSGKSSLTWGGSNAISYEHEVLYMPNSALVIKGKVATPFQGYESIEVDMNNRRRGNTFTAANEWKLSRYGSTTLGGTLSYQGYDLDANLVLTTPCRSFERVAISLKNTKQQDVWVTRGSLEYPPGKSISAETKLGWESEKKFDIEINTPHDYMRTMKFTSEFTGTARNFRVSSELEHNAFDQGKITFAVSADTQSSARARAEMSLRTPFAAVSNFKVTAGHTRQTAQNCVTVAAYEFNDKRGSLNSEVMFRSWRDFNTKSELEYVNGRKIELNTAFSTDPKISGSATLKTPFPKVRELGVTFSHDGPSDNFKSAVELSYNRREKINANAEFTMSGGNVRVYSRLTTPFKSLERSVYEITHSGSPGNYRSAASFELNDQRLATNGELLVEDDRLRINGKLETPFRQLREATATLDHTGPWRRFSNRAELTYDGSSITGSSEFNIEGPTGKFSLTTPYRQVQSVNLEFSHENKNSRQSKGWSNSASLELNRQRYTAGSEVTLTGKVLKAKANVKIPQEYSIALQHRGDSIKDFTNSVALKMDDQTATGSSSFKYASSLIEGKATLETSYQGYSKFETTFKHEGPVGDFKTKLTVSTPFRNYRSFGTELTYTGNPNEFTSAFSVDSTFQSVPRIQISANHRYTGQALNSGITIATSTSPIQASVSYKKDGSALEAGARLETPYDGYEKFEMQFKHTGTGESFQTSATVTTPFSGYERFYGELNHAGAWSRFTTSGKFESSATPSLAFSVDNNSPGAWRINTALEVEIPAGKIGVTVTNNGEPGNFRSGLRVTTPYRAHGRFEVNVEHEGGTTAPKSKITVQTPYRGYTNFQLSTEKSGDAQNLQLKAELTSSVPRWEKTAISWSHSGAGSPDFQSTATVETSVSGYERQSLTIAHSARRNVKTTVTAETSIPGYTRFTGNFEYSATRKVRKSSVSVETSMRGYERFAGSVEVTVNDADTFGASIDVTTPIRGYERFGATFNHDGDLSQFETSAKITTPFRTVPQIEVLLRHRGQIDNFETSGKVTIGDEAIEGETAFKRTLSRYESNYETRLKITSTYNALRELNVAATHVRQQEVKSGTLDVTYNGEKKVDLDYKYKTSGDRELEVNIRNPYSMSTSLTMTGNDGQAVVNWDTNSRDSQVKFDFGFKDTTTSELTDRSMRFKVVGSRRTVGFEFGYTASADRFTNRGELQWDSDAESEFAYEIEASRSSARYTSNYDAKLKVMSGLTTTTSTFSHKTQVRRKHVTELVIESTDRLRLSNEVVMTSTGFTDTFTVQHPSLSQDFTVTTEGTASTSGSTYGIKTTVRFDRQSFILEGQIVDEPPGGATQSSISLRFAHPSSSTDVKLTGDVACNDVKVTGNAEIQYQMSRDRSIQKFGVKTELNKVNKDFSFEISAPFDQLRLTATNRYAGYTNGMIGYEAAAQMNQMNLKAIVDISRNDRSFEAKLFYTQADYMRLFVQSVSPLQGRLELSRYIDNGYINDITANLSFSDERLLTGYSFLRPNLYDELVRSIRPDRLYPRELAAQGQQWASAMRDDLNLKGQRLRNAVAPLANAVKAMVNDVSAKIDQLQTEFNAVYDRNEFYIRDIDLAMKRAVNQIADSMTSAYVEMKRSYDVFAYRVQRYMANYKRLVQQRIDRMTVQMTESLQAVADWFAELQPHFDNAMATVRAHFEDLKNHPRVRAVVDRLNSLQLSDFLPPADWQQTLARSYNNYRSQLDEILSRPELRELRDWFIKRVEESMWVYEYLGYRDQMDNWIKQARSLTWSDFKVKVVDYVKETLQLHKNRWTTWDVSRGEYGFQVFVPFDPRDFSFVQRFNVGKYICQARTIITNLIPEEDWTLLDRIFAYWPSSDRSNWIPPFKSHASITGTQHFITFDHKSYEFAGECSYLLTRDFVDKTFSVVVNYDKAVNNRPVRRSITAVSAGKQVEVYPDGKVTVDGVRAEMPLRVDNATTVTRTGNAVRIDNDRGFGVVCDLVHDHCSVSVSGWYYNKMAGLLGTYDNEPSNDLTTVDNSVAETPENLAYSWTVGQKCRPNNRAVVVQTVDEDSKAYGICSRYFKNPGSLFRGCFRVVDPEPFFKMCVNDMPSADESASEADMCNVAAAYVQECRRHEVHLRMPRQCVRCEVGDSSSPQFESSTFTYDETNRAPKAADVVFIVQHSSCNKDLLDKVKGLVDDLEKAMRAEDLTSTRYSIVGFGGKDHLQSPHTHTMDSQVFNSANKVVQGLSRFNLEAGDVRDPMDAIRYAAKLAFRPGASKTFVLLACDKCSQERIRYRDLQMTLLESDIKLHVFVQEIIRVKSNSAKTAYIFGADRDTVYTRQDVADNELRGESDLRRYIIIPKDLCAALTQDTSGSVFSARQWLDSRPIIQKRFSDVMVRTFARKAKPSDCQECECIADEYGVGYARCRSCDAPQPFYWWYPDFETDVTEIAVAPPTKVQPPVDNRPVQVPEEVKPTRAVPTRRPRVTPRPRLPRPTVRPRKAVVPRARPQQQQQQQA